MGHRDKQVISHDQLSKNDPVLQHIVATPPGLNNPGRWFLLAHDFRGIFDVETSLDMNVMGAKSEINTLSVSERILMVQEIWESIAAEQQSLAVTEGQKTELDRRLAANKVSPNEGRSWEEIRHRLKASK